MCDGVRARVAPLLSGCSRAGPVRAARADATKHDAARAAVVLWRRWWCDVVVVAVVRCGGRRQWAGAPNLLGASSSLAPSHMFVCAARLRRV
eukprot:405070-Prymnesium_polylepis.2